MNEHRIAIIGAGYSGVALGQLIRAMEKAYSIDVIEPQSEITGAWIDEMFQLETEPLPNTQLNIQYGPQKKRGKGKVKKW